MFDIIIDIFVDYKTAIIFLHIISASLLIGSMFVIIFIIRPAEKNIKNVEVKCRNCLRILTRYIIFLVPIMLVIVSASVFMSVGMGFKYGNPAAFIIIHIKETIWLFIAFNFLYMYKKYLNAKRAFEKEDFLVVQENIILIIRYLIPLNLVVSMIAVYFGIIMSEY